ncbi:MAG: carbamoyltransferase C-terminal domain-containing protein [Candidatus Jordarchaeum sp.]|uniref:carbamoyltransferase C-terminal domain-containing protein n=1 Tax=Candidatus Jordarchaeum sp. TaxID=2823881 RepID=UPI0040496779
MLTLGIHDGHTATACLFEDGEVIACISEERLNRIKEWSGFPEQALRKCFEITGKSYNDVGAVGVCSLLPQIGTESWYRPNVYKRAFASLVKLLPKKVLQSSNNIKTIKKIGEVVFHSRKKEIVQKLKEIGIGCKNVFFFEHHLSHAATCFYLNWHKNCQTLVITLDGSGDAVCATVNVGRNGEIERVAEIFNYNSICDFYTRITQYLGMKPMSHEYKVMGMAPYASGKERKEIFDIFKKYFRLSEKNPLLFVNNTRLYKWQFTDEFKKRILGKRFDWIAGAVQDLFEDLVLKWVKNAIRATGIGDLAVSGGGFMNVKLNYLISKLPEVSSLFVFPSCGDESNPVGASILAALKMGFLPEKIKPLKMIYWGPSYNESEIRRAIEYRLSGSGFKIKKYESINDHICEKILEGKIVGRFTGRMEWGARALGNRTILADPRDSKIIHKINKAIKMRDFWMPFAPAVLKEYRNEYLLLREDFHCPFMTIAPDTKPRAWEDIPAGLHPFDKSSRAQILDPENHGSFYELVKLFEKKTRVGGIINTSFNLHGDPIVCSPDDAIDTFLKSELDVLQLENFIIEK